MNVAIIDQWLHSYTYSTTTTKQNHNKKSETDRPRLTQYLK